MRLSSPPECLPCWHECYNRLLDSPPACHAVASLPCLLAYLFCLPYLPALPFGPCLLAYPILPALQTYWIRHSCLPFLASLSASLLPCLTACLHAHLPCLYTCSICVASPVALSAFPASLHYVTSLFAHSTTCLTYLPGLCALPALLCLPASSASSTLHCPPTHQPFPLACLLYSASRSAPRSPPSLLLR